MSFRYFEDWQRLAGCVPDVVFPETENQGNHLLLTSKTTSNVGLGTAIDLSNKAAALATMQRSLDGVQSAKDHSDAKAKVSYDVVAAAQRQRIFFYQVSLPHYRNQEFRQMAVDRYATSHHQVHFHPVFFCFWSHVVLHSHTFTYGALSISRCAVMDGLLYVAKLESEHRQTCVKGTFFSTHGRKM